MAVAVLGKVRQSFPEATLTMVGPDKGDGSLAATRKAAANSGLRGSITFTGPVAKEAVPEIMAQHDVFINTTSIDNMPVSVIEAMACGLGIVSTNAGGLPYLLTDQYDGLLVPPDDPAAMSAAVHRILSNPVLAGRISQNARAKAEEFDWSRVLPQWQTILLETAAQKTA
jgi:glycosyltransferase involved in cell wall biosynthesis